MSLFLLLKNIGKVVWVSLEVPLPKYVNRLKHSYLLQKSGYVISISMLSCRERLLSLASARSDVSYSIQSLMRKLSISYNKIVNQL